MDDTANISITELTQNKLFRVNVNFVYEELLNQFLNNNGDCKLSTFWLIGWGIICNPKNDGIYGKLEKEVVYKCYMSYMINLFSRYIKTRDDSEILNEIQAILYNGNLIFSTPFSFSVTNELKIVCLKAMAYLVKHNPDDKFSEDFRNILINQDLINADMYDDYSTEKMYQEVCNVLKKEKYIKEKSFLKSVSDLISEEFRDYNNGRDSYRMHIEQFLANVIENDEFDDDFENDENTESNSSNSSFYFTRTDNSKNFVERVAKRRKTDHVLLPMAENQMEDKISSINDNNKDEEDGNSSDECDEDESANIGREIRVKKPWTEQEEIYLVFFVKLIGRSWLEMSQVYRSYFQNRDRKDLLVKYTKLEKNEKRLKDLKKKSESLKEKDFKKEERIVKKRKIFKWDQTELAYLVHGVEKYGKRWAEILTKYQKYFKSSRKATDLQGRYAIMEKNEVSLTYFKKQAKLIRD